MFIDNTTRCGKDLIRGFRGGFLERFVMDWSIVDPDEDTLSKEDIEETKQALVTVTCNTKSGNMSDWQTNFFSEFPDKCSMIETQLIDFLKQDDALKKMFKSQPLERLVECKQIRLYPEKEDGVDFLFSSVAHEAYFVALKWKENEGVEYTHISI